MKLIFVQTERMSSFREKHILRRMPERIMSSIMKNLLLCTNPLEYMETNGIEDMIEVELINNWRKRTYARYPLGSILSESISKLGLKAYEWMK